MVRKEFLTMSVIDTRKHFAEMERISPRVYRIHFRNKGYFPAIEGGKHV
jgi:hypothetical protein